MNKYFGFYELKSTNLPTVAWERFSYDTELDKGLLWTIRVAVEGSDDLNLPRLIGAKADEASAMGKELLDRYSGRGMVVYYPYFIAEKSGVLEINNRHMVIEAVDRDLWNLVTYGRKDVTIIISSHQGNESVEYFGGKAFLAEDEITELKKYSSVIKGRFRDEISEGKSIFAEWSYAYNTDIRNMPIGLRHLFFYELRTVR